MDRQLGILINTHDEEDDIPEPCAESFEALLARSEAIRQAQYRIHEMAYDLFEAIDQQSQQLTVQAMALKLSEERLNREAAHS